ncbi:MAG: hypothetical protein K0U74_10435 [Alphaproteobacteria bacterium]|nr:hypothetical protein [Alphaproteobacteria bacterium]
MESRMPVVIVGILLSISLMVWCVAGAAKFACLGAALGFAMLMVEAALATNRPILKDAKGALSSDAEAPLNTARRNGRLMAMVYAWGAGALLAIYGLTELWWFHSWQYAIAMVLIAGALLGYVHLLGDKESQFRSDLSLDVSAYLAMAQAAGAAMGLGFLIGSGKFASIKTDWPANHVFIAGGLALIVISVIAAITHLRLRRAAADSNGA